MPPHKSKDHVCGRLGQDTEFGRTDFCDRPQSHKGKHHGKYHGMEWEDVPGRRDRSQVSKHGTGYIPDTGGNIRGTNEPAT